MAVPDGAWVVLRFGYTINGAHVSTSGSGWTGLVLDYLDAVSATGVITGQHGRGTLRRAILGGLSLRLLREAPCPVVVQP